jgi:indole-3-glycerol phosphate synthase
MTDFLQSMVASSAERAAAVSPPRVADARPPLPLRLGAFDVIAEIKDHSPAAGRLAAAHNERSAQALRYAAGGAAAISVLTEPSRFAGAMQHLAEVVAAVPDTPVMCKDFLVEPVQILEARSFGASGVLLIATMLSNARLGDMLECAFEHDMFVLLETFDANDLGRVATLLDMPLQQERALRGQLLVGVNTRNLRTLEVDPARLADLAPRLPNAKCVAESGLNTAEDAANAAALGYHLALVGTALMRSADPAALIAEMRAAGSARIAA